MKRYTIKPSLFEHPVFFYPMCLAFCIYDYVVFKNLLQRVSTLSDAAINILCIFGVLIIDVGFALVIDHLNIRKKSQHILAAVSIISFALMFTGALAFLAFTNVDSRSSGLQMINQFVTSTAATFNTNENKIVNFLSSLSTVASTAVISAMTMYRKEYILHHELEKAMLEHDATDLESQAEAYYSDPAHVVNDLLSQGKARVLLRFLGLQKEAVLLKQKFRELFAVATGIDRIDDIIHDSYPIKKLESPDMQQYESDYLLAEQQHTTAVNAIPAANMPPKQLSAPSVLHTVEQTFGDIASASDPELVPAESAEPAEKPTIMQEVFPNEPDALMDYEEDVPA